MCVTKKNECTFTINSNHRTIFKPVFWDTFLVNLVTHCVSFVVSKYFRCIKHIRLYQQRTRDFYLNNGLIREVIGEVNTVKHFTHVYLIIAKPFSIPSYNFTKKICFSLYS